ncbi:MAG: ATP phosphoribosyltransferase regulatory subunit [Hyphomicrobiales bacterium]
MSRRQIIELLETSGYMPVDPPILQPADVFLDLVGEDIRTRLFTTEDQTGKELCLRPELTIPICRHHMETGDAARTANYGYLGPAFRFRTDESGEFAQAGIESLGRTDTLAADAEVLALSASLATAGGLANPSVLLGDSAIFMAFVEGLGFAPRAARRLRRALGSRARVEAALEQVSRPVGDDEPGILTALSSADPDEAQALVEDLMNLARIQPVGGRSSAEIAERFIEKSARMAAKPLSDAALTCLEALIHLEMPAREAPSLLKRLAQVASLDLDGAIDALTARLDAFDERNLPVASMMFCGWAGGRLDYYTGFTFEMRADDDLTAPPAVSGGRFDGLLERLGASKTVPAVGAALWLDRLPKGGDQ